MSRDEAANPPAQYEQRYCAFVDILGFRELINRLSQGATPVDALRNLLRSIHEPPRGENIRFFKTSDLKAQSISDAVCLSAACSAPGLAHLFHILDELARLLLLEGFFIRGAIVKGNLYHDDKMVFGEALVRAYSLEQEVVRYPRIMVTSDIVREVNDTFLEEHDLLEFVDRLQQSDDGPHFLHILSLLDVILSNQRPGEERDDYLKSFNAMAGQIQRRFDEAVDNPRRFEKVQWFAKYWNRTLQNYAKDVMQVVGPGADAVWG